MRCAHFLARSKTTWSSRRHRFLISSPSIVCTLSGRLKACQVHRGALSKAAPYHGKSADPNGHVTLVCIAASIVCLSYRTADPKYNIAELSRSSPEGPERQTRDLETLEYT